GSVNVSQVHYDDDDIKELGSATALSTIIHPKNPYAPSLHMHISWTEMKIGHGYWRMMADLNPVIENKIATDLFSECLKIVALTEYESASKQGDKYFYIPALGRHRGVSHFYLEEYNSNNEQVDYDLAKAVGKAVVDAYITIVFKALEENPNPGQKAYQQQQDYHTLYLFQVLTLDRGTSSGLLVHDQNDLGIMGSLPSHINKALLTTWVEKLQKPQDQLLLDILAVLPDEEPCLVNEAVKLALAKVLREYYQKNPDALAMQAQGYIIPPTVNNHVWQTNNIKR
ncbi:MAG: coproporphyrinogen III oxidase, partial [Methylococcales bacterium]|nr:coproporphyrinogen III oxidase [Methylococcales bacterium]